MAHYTRWHRYGSPTARVRGEIVDGCKVCPGCGEDKVLSEYYDGQSRCKECNKAKRKPQKATPHDPLFCVECGTVFIPVRRNDICCSLLCGAERKKRFDREDSAARNREQANAATRAWYRENRDRAYQAKDAYRARKKNAFVEQVNRVTLYERDSWMCQICCSPVDREAVWPDPRMPSVDHRIPLARGGEHSYANCQTAHLGCNIAKGARMIA